MCKPLKDNKLNLSLTTYQRYYDYAECEHIQRFKILLMPLIIQGTTNIDNFESDIANINKAQSLEELLDLVKYNEQIVSIMTSKSIEMGINTKLVA